MVDKPTHLLDTPLPVAMNFAALKAMGIEQLKSMAGETWSNFNDSDPGVTILDQLCYALTELGYCADFPIEDVLTGQDGQICYDGQFFEPQQILTCSPITPDDYRKLVHDCIDAVEAIYINVEFAVLAGDDSVPVATGRYLTSLRLAGDTDNEQDVVDHVHKLLNGHRNLGEMFVRPTLLAERKLDLVGSITLDSTADVTYVQSQILSVLKTYAVPPVIYSGYQQLRERGVEADEIFNGPTLRKGWISGPQALGNKRGSVNLFDLHVLLSGIQGVGQLQGLRLTEDELLANEASLPDVIDISDDQVPVINCSSLVFLRNTLEQAWKSRDNRAAEYLSQMQLRHRSASVECDARPYPSLPQGLYRNIEACYSVQNTFPDVYGIGSNALQSSLADPRVASSRQLKGYLLVYDQLLANQFSQLAHVGDLFSFKPSLPVRRVGRGADCLADAAYDVTYYCQPLYEVPGVMPLLRGNEAFHYKTDPLQPNDQVEREAWVRFRYQPRNTYVQGLRNLMESMPQAQQRRDRMLSHLLARHGEQADRYDDLISVSHWYGNNAKNRTVVKSIWLQNYQKLSYYRTGALDMCSAAPLKTVSSIGLAYGGQGVTGYSTRDGQLDEALVYSQAQLTTADFCNYSTFELKVDILLGLSAHLRALASKIEALLSAPDFEDALRQSSGKCVSYSLSDTDISVALETSGHQICEGGEPLITIVGVSNRPVVRQDYINHLGQLQWLASQRKGLILIEHLLLLPDAERGLPAYYLSASLIFPDYIELVTQKRFKDFVQTLVEQHWPAHVEIIFRPMSHGVLRALIPYFITWHNNLKDVGLRAPAARILARLLGLPRHEEVTHAG